MSWLDWFCRNPSGTLRGPVYCPQDCYITGGEVWEQGGYGVVDIRLEYRNRITNDTGWTGWLCGNPRGKLRGPIITPFGHYVVGMAVDEQGGYGVIDLSFTYREKSSSSDAVQTSERFTNNLAASRHHGPLSAPPGEFITGIVVMEQGGYGIVDVRLHYGNPSLAG
jgi:hypothetical protein